MQLKTLGQIAFTVQDVERATRFYRDTLGMKHLFSVPNMAFFDCDGIRLMLTLPIGHGATGDNSILYFRVADIKAAHRELEEKSVRFEAKPYIVAKLPEHDVWLAEFRDSEGNLLALMSEAGHS